MNTAKRIAKSTGGIAYFSKAILSNIFIQTNTIISEFGGDMIIEKRKKGELEIFSKGYRPSGRNQHISVVRFAELFLRSTEAKGLWVKGVLNLKNLRFGKRVKTLLFTFIEYQIVEISQRTMV